MRAYSAPEEEGDLELWHELAPVQADGSVCIIQEVGYRQEVSYQKSWPNGWAIAFANTCDLARPIPDKVLTIHPRRPAGARARPVGRGSDGGVLLSSPSDSANYYVR
jgi:hypothetical protein